MAVIVMIVIIFLAAMFGAELGPKADPTTTTYVPRPDWYFFFLFEVLRVMKNVPKFTDMATIGVPTICMILLFLLPFYDRSPERAISRRPVALAAGLTTIFAMAFLTYSGANTGSPNSVDLPAAVIAEPRAGGRVFRAGEVVVGQSGCLACHVIGENGNNGPGPPLTHIGIDPAPRRDRLDAAQPDGADALVRGPGRQPARRSSRTWSPSCRAPVAGPRTAPSDDGERTSPPAGRHGDDERAGDAARAPGPGDVRSHRRRL